METIGVPELLIIVVIVILLFGVGRISKIGAELGGGIRAFREGLHGDEPVAAGTPVEPAPAQPTMSVAPAAPPTAEPDLPADPVSESKDGLT